MTWVSAGASAPVSACDTPAAQETCGAKLCIALSQTSYDCVTPTTLAIPATEASMDANYPLLLQQNPDAMHRRCTTVAVQWAADGYTCVETLSFPYIERVPATNFQGSALRFLGSVLGL
jgi:hypothetical protein